MPRPSLRSLFRAIAAAAAATIAVMFVYASVQQTYRTAANDPQEQLAHDAAADLKAGVALALVLPRDTVDMASDLAPFVIVYDAANRPLAGSALLDGALPVPPAGVLELARKSGAHSITWMPRRSVRVASVLHAVGDGSGRVVLAARSLREAEERESRLLVMAALAWAGLLVAAVAAALL